MTDLKPVTRDEMFAFFDKVDARQINSSDEVLELINRAYKNNQADELKVLKSIYDNLGLYIRQYESRPRP